MKCSDQIKELDSLTIKRYNERFNKYGVDARSLGWGSAGDQRIRFETAVKYVNFSKKSVLDVGCGFADFFGYLSERRVNIDKYRGIDINTQLLEVAARQFSGNEYEVRNILLNNYEKTQAQIVTMFGLLNFKLKEMSNLDYSRKMISASWKITQEVLVVDFLSAHLAGNYPKEDFVYYHDPKDVLDICFDLCEDVVMVHNYAPIPQKEFMVIMTKAASV